MLIEAFSKIDKLKKEKKLRLKNYKLQAADCHNLPFEDSAFDTVVNTFVLESVYDMDQAFSEIKRVCKP